jgi:ABC-2 type transport system ATP-binding protein
MSEAVMEASGVQVRHGDLVAVRDLSVSLEPGRLTGLIGPDGAGKTSAIRALTGLQPPAVGEILLSGRPLGGSRDRLASLIGYMPQRFSLYVDLTVEENIAFFARLHGVGRLQRRVGSLLSKMGLARFRRRLAGNLSGGMKQKLALLCVLVHEPSLIIMDEPTTGVDPLSRRELWRILGELAAESMSILVATPYLDEAERCHEVLLMHRGRTILEGDPSAMVEGLEHPVYDVPTGDAFSLKTDLQRQDWVRTVQTFGNRLHLTCRDPADGVTDVSRRLSRMGVEAEVERARPSLEDVFIEAVHG